MVVPVATTDDGARYPKYTEREGVNGYSGTDIDFSAELWSGLNYPFIGSEQYVVRVVGDGTTLDGIEAESDAHTMTTLGVSKSEVASILNQRFGRSRSFAAWARSFGAGDH